VKLLDFLGMSQRHHSCRYCWCAARRCADVARAGSDSALRRWYVRHHALILLSYCSFLLTFLPTRRTAEKEGNLASLSVFSWVRCTLAGAGTAGRSLLPPFKRGLFSRDGTRSPELGNLALTPAMNPCDVTGRTGEERTREEFGMARTWHEIRTVRYSPMTPPAEWPDGVQPISIEGVSL